MSSMLEYKGYHASVKYDAEDNIKTALAAAKQKIALSQYVMKAIVESFKEIGKIIN